MGLLVGKFSPLKIAAVQHPGVYCVIGGDFVETILVSFHNYSEYGTTDKPACIGHRLHMSNLDWQVVVFKVGETKFLGVVGFIVYFLGVVDEAVRVKKVDGEVAGHNGYVKFHGLA